MENATSVGNSYVSSPALARANESPASAVSWAAVIAGAVIASAVSFMLLAGGAGLGFVSMSPWSGDGASAATLGIGAIVWMILTHIISFGVGGYLAGRLRTKWVGVHTDETYFRDTAHGFLVWALSAVVGVVLLASSAASIVSGTAKAGAALAGAGAGAAAAMAGQAAQNGEDTLSLGYFTDALLRPDDSSRIGGQGDVRQEVSRILARSVVHGQLSDEDQSYLVKVVAQQAGLDESAARQRITQIGDQAKKSVEDAEQAAREAADAARKAAAAFSIWAFVSLLIGAFVASFAATIGGRERDR